MILTLIGMSGVGKSYWAARLAAYGFAHIDCDALIAERLQTPLGSFGGWMGFPDEPEFPAREAAYLACEAAVLREAAESAARAAAARTDLVVDTSGSAIYVEAALLEALRCRSTVVYMAVTPAIHAQMLSTYLERPRPVVWNGLFQPAPGESRGEAFRRCYPRLVDERDRLYRSYSDVTLAHAFYRRPELSVPDFLEAVRAGCGREP